MSKNTQVAESATSAGPEKEKKERLFKDTEEWLAAYGPLQKQNLNIDEITAEMGYENPATLSATISSKAVEIKVGTSLVKFKGDEMTGAELVKRIRNGLNHQRKEALEAGNSELVKKLKNKIANIYRMVRNDLENEERKEFQVVKWGYDLPRPTPKSGGGGARNRDFASIGEQMANLFGEDAETE